MLFTSRTPVKLFFFFFLTLLSVSQAYAWEESWGHIYDDYCTPSDCVMYLPMDEGSGGEVGDTTPNENNGTINGSSWTTGKFANGLEFDGVDDYVNVLGDASLNVTTGLTMTVWVYVKSVGDIPHTGFINKGNEGGGVLDAYSLIYNTNPNEVQAKVVIGSTAYYASAVGAFTAGSWHFLAGTFNGTYVVLYVDGVAVKTTSAVGSINTVSADLDIGRAVTSKYMNGTIDEVLIYNRSLSAAEILQQYQIGWLLLVQLKDEDTGNLITGELGTVNIYDATNSTIVAQITTTTGETGVSPAMVIPTDMVISAYTNESYTNQRRRTYFTSGPGEYTTTIWLLQDGRGLAQPFKVYDRTTYQGLQAAGVMVNYSGEILDYGVTGSQGRLYSYLDPYKLYSVVVNKPGYESSQEYTLTPSTDDFIVYLLKLFTRPPVVSVTWNPSGSILSLNNSYIPMVSIKNYQELTAIDFIIAKGRTYLDYYRRTGQEQAGTVDHETFDMQNLSWCNATWICSYTNISTTFRYSQDALDDYSDYAIVQYNATKTDGVEKTGEKTYLFSDFKVNIAGLFTDTQKPFVAFGIMFFGTFLIVRNLVRRNYNPSVKQIGAIVYILLIVTYKFDLIPGSYLVLGTMIYLGALLGGKQI